MAIKIDDDDLKADRSFERILLGDSYDSFMESKKGEVVVRGPEDVNTPLYRKWCWL